MGRRNLHSRDELADLALSAAADIVDADGAAALSMREVARRIGYTVGALYMVFVNLDDLIVRINERTVAELAKSFDAVNRKTDESHERLRLLTAAYLGFALLHTHRWRLVFEHRLPEGQHAPATYRTHTAAIFRLVSENLRGCRPRRDKARIDELAIALWAGVHGVCMLAVTGKLQVGGPTSVQRLLDLLISQFIDVDS
ncbi:MAG TPA: WHG domain-containing protein [Steroidobacteraceae bacterium]|nr:WHG domain-containing protein [Steroidobacteraceae bacterium]